MIICDLNILDVRLSTVPSDNKLCMCLNLSNPRMTRFAIYTYRQVSNISPTPVGNKIVDHSDVVGASPVGAAPTTSSFST